jgi:hypothetical protein
MIAPIRLNRAATKTGMLSRRRKREYEMQKLGFGQDVGQIIQMAYVVEDIHASINW